MLSLQHDSLNTFCCFSVLLDSIYICSKPHITFNMFLFCTMLSVCTEYRPLPSPTRSSLRSPNKDPTIRSKEGYRVTFADKNFSDLSSENDTPDKPLQNSSDINCTRKPHYSNADKSGESAVPRDCRSQNFRNNCLTPTPVRSKATGDNERTKFSLVDGADRYTGDLKNLTKPSYADEPKFSSERLLRASTDLYVSTHLNDSPLASNHLSALRKGFTDVPGIYTLPSKPTLGLSRQFTSKMESQSEYGDPKKTWRSDNVAAQKMDILANGMKRSSSLNSLLTPKPVSSYAVKYVSSYNTHTIVIEALKVNTGLIFLTQNVFYIMKEDF
ncbi:hypothetical protein XENTR_v10011716 [Xenopus tropicalis]|nr:hypothetical protein XENTR_v10011716 [Xenopus tropicalis]